MKYFVANVVSGFGPILRLGELLQETNALRVLHGKEPVRFIIPSPSSKLESILKEEFVQSGMTNQIFLDPTYGKILDNAVFKGNDYRAFLKNFVKSYPETQTLINSHFERPFAVVSLNDKECKMQVDPSECTELARNPIVKLPFSNGISYGFGNRSDFLREMRRLGKIGYSEDFVDAAIGFFERGPESPKEIELVQDPSTVSPSRSYIDTPFHSLARTHNKLELKPGIYVSVTGIPSLGESIIKGARRIGYQMYCAPSAVKDFPEAIPQNPDVVTNPSIKGVLSRLGWGAINLALMNGKPLIALPSDITEDPEIVLNERLLVHELKVASLMDGRPWEIVFDEATKRAENTCMLVSRIKSAYGILEGPKYAAMYLANLFINQ